MDQELKDKLAGFLVGKKLTRSVTKLAELVLHEDSPVTQYIHELESDIDILEGPQGT